MSDATRGAISIAGGMIAHLALGTMYCWGNFMSYAPRSLLFFDGGAAAGRTPDALLVLPGALLGLNIGLQFGSRLNSRIGTSKTALLGGLAFAASVFLGSYQTRLAPFMAIYSLLFGISIGTAYTAPMVAGWSWFPDRKGFVSGCVLAAFGAGGFFGNKIASAIVNPNKLQAPFPPEIYDGFAPMLRKLSVLYAGCAVLGSAMIKTNPAAAGARKAVGKASGKSVGEALASKEFWLLFAMIALSATAGLNTIGVYKTYGQTVPLLNDDAFLSLLGGLGALSNGLGRLFWGTMVDKFGFGGPFTATVGIMASSMALFQRVASFSKLAFATVVCLLFSSTGGLFAMAPPVCNIVFGTAQAAQIYSALFSAFVVASIGGSILTKSILKSSGWDSVFTTMATMSTAAILLNTQL
jgi:OFA family oxalate/formate antiporter-like MFS transporter